MMSAEELISELVDKLIAFDTDPGEIHPCPICSGKLHVWFGAYNRDEQRLFGAHVKCESCGIQMAVDYAMPPPPWIVDVVENPNSNCSS